MTYSQETDKIFGAIASFQGEIVNPPRSASNPFFKSKYTPLDAIIDHVRPCLKKHCLSVMQFPCSNEKGVGIITVISHSSGQFVESDPYFLTLSKQDAQAGGSAITYARRYALAAALGIASDTDDDANTASDLNKAKKDGKAPILTPCHVCGKLVGREFAEKSKATNAGIVYCSGTCRSAVSENV